MQKTNFPQLLMDLRSVHKTYPARGQGLLGGRQQLHALTDLSFRLYEGECLGLVGESGCGKSTAGRQIVGLERPDQGEIYYYGGEAELDIAKASWRQLRGVRSELQMIFQNSSASLNPRKHIYEILAAPLIYNGLSSRKEAPQEVDRLLEMVGLPKGSKARYPHEFSGGQRQRIAIARALALRPRLIVCDEAISALDASVQAQILNLLQDLQKELKLTYLFIGHGLASVRHISDRVAVMYLGQIVEMGEAQEIFQDPWHPYTQALVQAQAVANPRQRELKRELISGEAPSNIQVPTGCPFHPRCPRAQASCRQQRPQLQALALRSKGQNSTADCQFRSLACPIMERQLLEERGQCPQQAARMEARLAAEEDFIAARRQARQANRKRRKTAHEKK